ncbi:MAG: phosphate starvation-inducible protein PhoH, partial [Lachnospiraceae bacterium]|nr:phosphate starvation-inducible protein PhoH [Lachnospiraceae bacterium]
MSIVETIINIPVEHARNIFGQCDAYVKIIERALNVTVISRDSEIKVIGDADHVEKAKRVLVQLLELSKRGNVITEQNVNYAISLGFEDKEEALVEIDK